MQRSTIIKSLCMAGVMLSLLSVGTPSAYAATASTATTTENLQPSPRLTDEEKAEQYLKYLKEQISLYGDVKDKLIPLKGTKNTRDLGGYQTADGKWQIRPNRLIRSDHLNHLTGTDKHILAADHHVTSIVDFRTDGQANSLPDQALPGVPNRIISILGKYAFSDSNDFDGDGGFYIDQLELSKSAIDGYHEFLNLLLQNNYATLYHCSSGKDRTGIATVLIMDILGMSKETIMNDFMQSAQTGRTVEEAWLTEYYREITSRYGTLNRYITNKLGFSRLQQEKLREMYLVSTDGKNTPYKSANSEITKPTPATGVTHTAPTAPQTTSTPKVTPRTTKDVAVPATITTGMADKAVKSHKIKGKIISTKKLHTKYVYHLKAHKKWFKDAHLQKLLGHTAKHKRTTWKLVKAERIKIKGKTYTYYQVQDHAGHKAWILKAYVVKATTTHTN